MSHILLLILCLISGVAGCTPQTDHTNEQESVTVQNNSQTESFIQIIDSKVLATNLEIPWAITKTDDVFYITERPGSIARIEQGKVTREQIKLTKEVYHFGEGGLLGFVLDPDYKQNKKAYLYHTYEENGQSLNRVVEVIHQDSVWVETRTIIDRIKGDRFHHGGRIIFGPDQKLYITTGDALQEGLAQDLKDLAGKILRIERDGSIPIDNPFPGSPIYSLGHRNSQGLAWDDAGKNLYSSEHGPRAYDEINLIQAGKNYGWPEIQGDETKPGMETPLFHSGEETWAPAGMVYLDGKLYVAALRGSMVIGFDLAQGTSQVIWEGVGRVRDILLEGDKLYIVTSNTDGRGNPLPEDDKLIELTFTK